MASSLGLTGVCVKRRGWTNSRNFGRIYCYFSSQPETNIWFEIGMIWSPHHSKILNICYKTWSYSNNFSVFEIILIFALWFSSISNFNSKILNRKVKPSDQKQRVASRNQEFCSAKILVFLQTLPSFDFRDNRYFLDAQTSVQTLFKRAESDFYESNECALHIILIYLSWGNIH